MANLRVINVGLLLIFTLVLKVGAVKIEITHWNDVSGQLESFKKETSISSSAPEPCTDETRPECVGGLVNMVHWIHDKSFSKDDPVPGNKFRLSSGNLVGGESGWMASMDNSWKIFGTLAQENFQLDVAALGMKEFGAGVQQTVDFVNSTQTGSTKITLANTCDKSYNGSEDRLCKDIADLRMLPIVDSSFPSPYQIGVIGYVNPTVERLSLPGSLNFSAIVAGVREVVRKNKANIRTFIAIGDGSLETSKEILDAIPEVKLVIYGMGFGTSKDMTGQYPMKYKGGYIATAGRYGSTIGKLLINVDQSTDKFEVVKGTLISTSRPPALNEQAEKANTKFKELRQLVEKQKADSIARTRVVLRGGEACWRNECNLGNLVTDAMVHCALIDETSFNLPVYSVWHGGALFEDYVAPGALITKFDVHKWLPYHNRVHAVSVSGKDLWKLFEISATGINPSQSGTPDWRQFLQVSNGLEVYYDISGKKPLLTKVRIAQDFNGVPTFGDLKENEAYVLAISTFLFERRGVYNRLPTNVWKSTNLTKTHFDDDCVEEYLTALQHISVGLEERIWITKNKPNPPPEVVCKGSNTAVTVILTIVFFCIFLAILYVGYFYVIPRLRQTGHVSYPRNQD